jgi:hypothetical protein
MGLHFGCPRGTVILSRWDFLSPWYLSDAQSSIAGSWAGSVVGTFVVLQQAPPHSFSGAPVTHARRFRNKRAAVYSRLRPPAPGSWLLAPGSGSRSLLCAQRSRLAVPGPLLRGPSANHGKLEDMCLGGNWPPHECHSAFCLGQINNSPHRFRTRRFVVSIDGILSYCAPSATICSWSRWPKGPCPNRGHALWIP